MCENSSSPRRNCLVSLCPIVLQVSVLRSWFFVFRSRPCTRPQPCPPRPKARQSSRLPFRSPSFPQARQALRFGRQNISASSPRAANRKPPAFPPKANHPSSPSRRASATSHLRSRASRTHRPNRFPLHFRLPRVAQARPPPKPARAPPCQIFEETKKKAEFDSAFGFYVERPTLSVRNLRRLGRRR